MQQKRNKSKILFFREATFKVAELIFNYPNKVFHIRLLEKETGFSTTAVTDSIKELQDFNIITVEKTSLTTNIKSNMDSNSYRFYKLVFNLYRIKRYLFVDGIVDLFGNPEAVVLFGSFSKGEDIEESDIDLLVISENKPKELNDFLTDYEKDLKRKINIHILSSLTKSSNEFKNAVSNGIVLHGYVKVV